MEKVTFGFYHALGVTFDADEQAIKKAFRKLSLKLHPDRNPGDESAKDKFQIVNSSYACLSETPRREQYDAMFRMRCVLDQGNLTADQLRELELDANYMFPVLGVKTLGMREEAVLMLNLEDGLPKASVERWRNGENIDQRPLSSLRSVDADDNPPNGVKLAFREESSKTETKVHLLARSVGERGTIVLLLRTLTSAGAKLRTDDRLMPPPPRLTAWLKLSSTSLMYGKQSVRVFALLGRSKLLLFSDAQLRQLKQLITLETGAVQLRHTPGEQEFELTINPPTSPNTKSSAFGAGKDLLNMGKSMFKLTLSAETGFVAGQWATAISEGLMQAGLNAEGVTMQAPASGATGAGAPTKPKWGPEMMGAAPADPFDMPKSSKAAVGSGGGASAKPKTEQVAEADLLGDLGGGDEADLVRTASLGLNSDLRELVAKPTADIQAEEGEPVADEPPEDPGPSPHQSSRPPMTGGAPTPNLMGFTPSGGMGTRSSSQSSGSLMDIIDDAPLMGLSMNTPPMGMSMITPPMGMMNTPMGMSMNTPPMGMSMNVPPLGMTMAPSSMAPMVSSGAAASATSWQRQLTLNKPMQGSRLGLDIEQGSLPDVVVVCEVKANSAAEKAGLRVGERLYTVAGKPVMNTDNAFDLLCDAIGDIKLTVGPLTPPPSVPMHLPMAPPSDSAFSDSAFGFMAGGNGGGGSAPVSPSTAVGDSAFGFITAAEPSPPLVSSVSSPPLVSGFGFMDGSNGGGGSARVSPLGGGGSAFGFIDVGNTSPPADRPPRARPPAPSIPFPVCEGSELLVEWQLPVWAGDSAGAVHHYELQWRNEEEDWWTASSSSRTIALTRARLRGLRPASAYWLRVRSIGADNGKSDFSSSIWPALTPTSPPQAFANSDGSVHVFLEPLPPFATYYEVQWIPAAKYARGPKVALMNWKLAQADVLPNGQGGANGSAGPWSALAVAANAWKGATMVLRQLPRGGPYLFRVRTASEDGLTSPYSAPSSEVSTAVGALPPTHFPWMLPDTNAMVKQLAELGLTAEQATIALQQTGGTSVSAAADWHFGKAKAMAAKGAWGAAARGAPVAAVAPTPPPQAAAAAAQPPPNLLD
jgi:curved DNA-binding protein CbpA